MTTKNAAEALEEVLALEQKATPGTYRYSPWHVEEGEAAVRTSKGNLDWAITFASDNDAEFIATVVNFIRTHADTLRAALAQPQPLTDAQIVEIRDDHLPSQGEPFDCIAFARAILNATPHEHVYCPHCRPCKHSERVDAYDDVLRGLASYLSAGGFNSPGLIDPQEADAKIRWGIDNFVKVEVDRLLRATQSNGRLPENPATGRLQHRPNVARSTGSESGSAGCDATGGQIDGELPATIHALERAARYVGRLDPTLEGNESADGDAERLLELVERLRQSPAPSTPAQEPVITVSGPVACGKSYVMELIYKALRDAGLHPYSNDLAHERRMVEEQPQPPAKVWKLREAVYAAPPQAAPTQEPVATLRVERAKNGRLRNWLDGEWQRNLPVGEYPLYTTPQIDDWKAAAKYSSDCHAAEAEREFSHPIATVVNNNQPHWTAIIETAPNVTLNVGTKLYLAPQSNNGRLTNAGDSIDREPVQTPGESPAQSAPAQKPRAHGPVSEQFMRHHYGASGYHSTNAEGPEELGPRPAPGLHFDARGVLVPDAAPQPDEARELLTEVVRRYDDYRGKGVMPAPGEYQMVVGAIERIRAYLEKHK